MVQVTFDLRGKDRCAIVGHEDSTCHITFDVKIEFTGKACFGTGGH